MKTMFILKPGHKKYNGLIHVIGEKNLQLAINTNTIQHYRRSVLVEQGDYVTCCELHESINNDPEFGNVRMGGWKVGKVIKVGRVEWREGFYAVFPEDQGSGVYSQGVRMSTPEEIEAYEKKPTMLKYF